MTDETMRRTPLINLHRNLGARLVPFAGWEMPVQYAGILEEARAVRASSGLFDISHMGRAHVFGSGALKLLQQVTTNDVAALTTGQAQYSLLTNPQGGIIDDIIVYRSGESEFWLVINAGNTAKDLAWIQQFSQADSTVEDWTERTAMIAVQGPKAPKLVAGITDHRLLSLPRFSFTLGKFNEADTVFCRTGYTGEDGFELIVPAEASEGIWKRLQEAGAVPCGLGARDALRVEAGYPLYGHEIDDSTSPVEAGLMWVVKSEKGDFIGRDAILSIKAKGAGRKLVGILLKERNVPRQGYILYVGDRQAGIVTSGAFSPIHEHGVGMAYVDDPFSKTGSVIELDVRGKRFPVEVVPKKDLLGR